MLTMKNRQNLLLQDKATLLLFGAVCYLNLLAAAYMGREDQTAFILTVLVDLFVFVVLVARVAALWRRAKKGTLSLTPSPRVAGALARWGQIKWLAALAAYLILLNAIKPAGGKFTAWLDSGFVVLLLIGILAVIFAGPLKTSAAN